MKHTLKLKDRLHVLRIFLIFFPLQKLRENELYTDASSHGSGAVLMQIQDDGKMHPENAIIGIGKLCR